MEAGSLESRTGAISEAYSQGRALFFQIVLSFLALFFAHNVFAATLSYSPATQTYVTEATGYKCSATSCSTSPVFTCLYTDPCWAASGNLLYGFCSLIDPNTNYTMWSNNGGASCSAGFSWVGYWGTTSTLSYSCPSGTPVGDGSRCAICSDGSTPKGTYPNLTCDVCPIPSLTPLTDPVAIDFENGTRWRPDGMTAVYQEHLRCVETAIAARGGSSVGTSAYRPTQYQQHLFEIVQKDKDLFPGYMALHPECHALRDEITRAMGPPPGHGLRFNQPVATPGTSRHESGTAFDLTPIGLTDAQMTLIYAGCGVSHTAVSGEPWHVQ